MGNSVPMKTRHKRSKMLRILSEKKRRKFYEENKGKNKRVLFEEDLEDGYMHGYTENYIRVRAKYDPVLVNDVKSVQLVEISPSGAMDVVEREVEIMK